MESAMLPVSEGYGYVYRICVDIGAKAIDWTGLQRGQA